MTQSSQFINPSGLSTPTGYSHVAIASGGRTIYISGQVALDQDRNLVGKLIHWADCLTTNHAKRQEKSRGVKRET